MVSRKSCWSWSSGPGRFIPSATRFDVFVEDDPEVPFRYIVFEVDAPLSVEQIREADRRWGEG
jgi:hypothetical protein